MSLSVLVLVVVVFYASSPEGLGFTQNLDWVVDDTYALPRGDSQVPRVGDRVLSIDGVTYEEWRSDRTAAIPAPGDVNGRVPVELERNGRRFTIDYNLSAARPQRLAGFDWLLPLTFWAAGVATGLLVRPRDSRWLLMMLCWFNAAIWISAGFDAFFQKGLAAVVYHAFIWPTTALLVHIHLLVPSPLGAPHRRRLALGFLWIATAAFAILDSLRLIPPVSVHAWLFLGIVGSIGLLAYRSLHEDPAHRLSLRLMMLGTALGLSPVVAYVSLAMVAPAAAMEMWKGPVFEVAFIGLLPIWPLAYLYAIHRQSLGGLRYRANRVLGRYALVAAVTLFALVAYQMLASVLPVTTLPLALILVALALAVAAPAQAKLQHLLDRKIFGISYRPEEMLGRFSHRIPGATDRQALKWVLEEELLPSLMVRESAVWEVCDEPALFSTIGLSGEQLDEARLKLPSLLEVDSEYLDESVSPLRWVRLVLPLELNGRCHGIWLLGGRDPDDFYPASDIDLLSSLAKQIASAFQGLGLLETTRRDAETNARLNAELREEMARHQSTGRALRESEKRLSFQASHDPLTGLLSRAEFDRRLSDLLTQARGEGGQHALCYMDLDQFKIINDTCGHVAGDEILRQLAKLLTKKVRRSDALARLGGDEFALLIGDCTLEDAGLVASMLREQVAAARLQWEEKTFRLTVSIGVVPINSLSDSAEGLLSAADTACYAAKDGGRNRVHSLEPGDDELIRRHGEMEWVGRIHRALDDDRFLLVSQPIVPMVTGGHPRGFVELLVRMKARDGSVILPGLFMPAADRYRLTGSIDKWVIENGLSWLAERLRQPNPPEMVSFNVSGHSLVEGTFIDLVKRELAASGVPPKTVCFEITETVAIANLAHARELIHEIKRLGCHFALDDFGSGFSSFAYLKNLPVDYLKIDGYFIRDLMEHDVNQAIVASICEVSKAMGRKDDRGVVSRTRRHSRSWASWGPTSRRAFRSRAHSRSRAPRAALLVSRLRLRRLLARATCAPRSRTLGPPPEPDGRARPLSRGRHFRGMPRPGCRRYWPTPRTSRC